ncbi:MAG: hypothetical protein PHF51_00785 [Candidatus ainarchaeum sp.]|nr:hypothetical protein [Candidatus ainarchaeum sp.]
MGWKNAERVRGRKGAEKARHEKVRRDNPKGPKDEFSEAYRRQKMTTPGYGRKSHPRIDETEYLIQLISSDRWPGATEKVAKIPAGEEAKRVSPLLLAVALKPKTPESFGAQAIALFRRNGDLERMGFLASNARNPKVKELAAEALKAAAPQAGAQGETPATTVHAPAPAQPARQVQQPATAVVSAPAQKGSLGEAGAATKPAVATAGAEGAAATGTGLPAPGQIKGASAVEVENTLHQLAEAVITRNDESATFLVEVLRSTDISGKTGFVGGLVESGAITPEASERLFLLLEEKEARETIAKLAESKNPQVSGPAKAALARLPPETKPPEKKPAAGAWPIELNDASITASPKNGAGAGRYHDRRVGHGKLGGDPAGPGANVSRALGPVEAGALRKQAFDSLADALGGEEWAAVSALAGVLDADSRAAGNRLSSLREKCAQDAASAWMGKAGREVPARSNPVSLWLAGCPAGETAARDRLLALSDKRDAEGIEEAVRGARSGFAEKTAALLALNNGEYGALKRIASIVSGKKRVEPGTQAENAAAPVPARAETSGDETAGRKPPAPENAGAHASGVEGLARAAASCDYAAAAGILGELEKSGQPPSAGEFEGISRACLKSWLAGLNIERGRGRPHPVSDWVRYAVPKDGKPVCARLSADAEAGRWEKVRDAAKADGSDRIGKYCILLALEHGNGPELESILGTVSRKREARETV